MISTDIRDNELKKFRESSSGPAVAVVFDQDVLPVETAGVDWDEINTTFPENNQELYTYKKNSNTVQTVLVTYLDTTKKSIISISKTRF
jgi:hypothetical protein